MLGKFVKFKKRSDESINDIVTFQLAEANEIADIIIERIEKKIHILKELESDVDRKIAILEHLLKRVELVNVPSLERVDRYEEILHLKNKGFKLQEISRLLNIPVGEVELFLNLRKNHPQAKLSQ
ncbi:MAG: hypothetical protein N2511_01650 [Thermodesulfovibrionales bacterium]|nr:hypothetical protein [Thermodesulfovibrionales bacterium]